MLHLQLPRQLASSGGDGITSGGEMGESDGVEPGTSLWFCPTGGDRFWLMISRFGVLVGY